MLSVLVALIVVAGGSELLAVPDARTISCYAPQPWDGNGTAQVVEVVNERSTPVTVHRQRENGTEILRKSVEPLTSQRITVRTGQVAVVRDECDFCVAAFVGTRAARGKLVVDSTVKTPCAPNLSCRSKGRSVNTGIRAKVLVTNPGSLVRLFRRSIRGRNKFVANIQKGATLKVRAQIGQAYFLRTTCGRICFNTFQVTKLRQTFVAANIEC